MRKVLLAFLVAGAIVSIVPPTRAQSRAGVQEKPQATLGQLMKGTFYPAANVVFAAQDLNPADVPHAKDPNMATDLLASSYGKWEAVENSALALADVADLLMIPGRKCSNGLDMPVRNPDWAKFVQELRDAGATAYSAAKTRDQDKMIDAAGVLTIACQNCHMKYREKRSADRCK